jgi:hypothetical protein
MNIDCKKILEIIGIKFEHLDELNDYFFPREILLCETKYQSVLPLVNNLKTEFSSTIMTCLHKNAKMKQRWPLLNLLRQILSIYNFTIEPIRKCDGYTADGIKKYKRFFLIKQKVSK